MPIRWKPPVWMGLGLGIPPPGSGPYRAGRRWPYCANSCGDSCGDSCADSCGDPDANADVRHVHRDVGHDRNVGHGVRHSGDDGWKHTVGQQATTKAWQG